MKVLLDMVISPNGLIARKDGSEDWLPAEGWDEFLAAAKHHNNMVVGRETFELVSRQDDEYNFTSVDADHKVIVTRNKKFVAPVGYVVVHSPEEAIGFLESKSQKTLYLIGGGKLNAAFMKQRLVDQIQLTICPYIIGGGRPVIAPDDFDAELELAEYRPLSLGRLLVTYNVLSYK